MWLDSEAQNLISFNKCNRVYISYFNLLSLSFIIGKYSLQMAINPGNVRKFPPK